MTRPAAAGALGALLLAAALLPQRGQAVELNLADVSCAKYENEVLTSSIPGYSADPIDTVMWLFGFSTAKAGDRVMYGDSLRAYGFALDLECKDNPTTTLLHAATSVTSKRDNPMDLTRLDCATFEPRHAALRKTDPESANTLTMWMLGFAVGIAGSQILDPGALARFDAALDERCTKHPHDSVFDALSAPNPAVPASRTTAPAKPKAHAHGAPSPSSSPAPAPAPSSSPAPAPAPSPSSSQSPTSPPSPSASPPPSPSP